MATLAQIRDGIKTILEAAIPTLTVYPRIESVLTVPACVVWPADASYVHVMNRAHMEWPIDLYVLASKADDRAGQYDLDELIDLTGSGSIVAALHDDDLNLTGTQTHVTGMSGYGGTWDTAGIDHVGAVLRLTVHTPGAS